MELKVCILAIMITISSGCKNTNTKSLYYVVYDENKSVIGYRIHKIKKARSSVRDGVSQQRIVYNLSKDFRQTKTITYNEILYKDSVLLRRRIIKQDTTYKPHLHLFNSPVSWTYDSDFGKLMSYQTYYVNQTIIDGKKKSYKFRKLIAPETSHPVELLLFVDGEFELIQEKYQQGYGYYYNIKRLEKNVPSALLNFMKDN